MMRSNWPTSTTRHERGYGAAWDKLREFVLARDNHLCQCKHCKAEGRVALATEVDHVIPRFKGQALGWSKDQIDDPSNLAAINTDCHKRKTVEDNGGRFRPKVKIGIDGWPIR